ncbi:hypothetical protein HDU67_001065 [Dinochytrium kinnereticum]|nr:hypothetical protein HDU67_001065 [Dinochytrium kinnereticum]
MSGLGILEKDHYQRPFSPGGDEWRNAAYASADHTEEEAGDERGEEDADGQLKRDPATAIRLLVAMIAERDNCLKIASEYGLELIHAHNVVEAERDLFKVQLEVASSTIVDQGLLIAEKEVEIASLTVRCNRLSEQLRSTELKIIELSKPSPPPPAPAPAPSASSSKTSSPIPPSAEGSAAKSRSEAGANLKKKRSVKASHGAVFSHAPSLATASSYSLPRRRSIVKSQAADELVQPTGIDIDILRTYSSSSVSSVSHDSFRHQNHKDTDSVSTFTSPAQLVTKTGGGDIESDTSSITGVAMVRGSEDASSDPALAPHRVASDPNVPRLILTPTRTTRLNHHISSPALSSPRTPLTSLPADHEETFKALKESEHHLRRRVKRLSARVVELENLLEDARREVAASAVVMLAEGAEGEGRVKGKKGGKGGGDGGAEETLLNLVRELTIANRKMEEEVAETKRMLEVAQSEVAHLSGELEEAQNDMLLFGGGTPGTHIPSLNVDAQPLAFNESSPSSMASESSSPNLSTQNSNPEVQAEANASSTSLTSNTKYRSLEEDIYLSQGRGKGLRERKSMGSLFSGTGDDVKVDPVTSPEVSDTIKASDVPTSLNHKTAVDPEHSDPAKPISSPTHSRPSRRRNAGNRRSASSVSASVTSEDDASSASSRAGRRRRKRRNVDRNGGSGRRGDSLPSSTQIYLRTLHTLALSIHGRLGSADTVAMNRRLRRAFDLADLTRLSQSVISNISSDIQTLTARFPPPEPRPTPSSQSNSDEAGSIVFPIVTLVQGLLADIALLRSTLNDLSLAYYERVKERALEAASACHAAGGSMKTVGFAMGVEGGKGKVGGASNAKGSTRRGGAAAALYKSRSFGDLENPSNVIDEDVGGKVGSFAGWGAWGGWNWSPARKGSVAGEVVTGRNQGVVVEATSDTTSASSSSAAAPASAIPASTPTSPRDMSTFWGLNEVLFHNASTSSPSTSWKPSITLPGIFSTTAVTPSSTSSTTTTTNDPTHVSLTITPSSQKKAIPAPPNTSLATASAVKARFSLGRKSGSFISDTETNDTYSPSPSISTLGFSVSSKARARPTLQSLPWKPDDTVIVQSPSPLDDRSVSTPSTKVQTAGDAELRGRSASVAPSSNAAVGVKAGGGKQGTWATGGTVQVEHVWKWLAGYGSGAEVGVVDAGRRKGKGRVVEGREGVEG